MTIEAQADGCLFDATQYQQDMTPEFLDRLFEAFWVGYPKGTKGSKSKARKSYEKLAKDLHPGIIAGRLMHYSNALAFYEQTFQEAWPTMHATTFLNGRHEDFEVALSPADCESLMFAPSGQSWDDAKLISDFLNG